MHQGSGEIRAVYAALVCNDCDHEFPVRMPPLHYPLPPCPQCQAPCRLGMPLFKPSRRLALVLSSVYAI